MNPPARALGAAALLLLAVPSASAAAEAQPRVWVDLYGNAQSVREYERIHGVRVRVHRDPAHELPEPALREAIFDRVAGLRDRIRKLDALDRDRLFLLAAGPSVEPLAAAFPAIPRSLLERLRVEVRAEGFPVGGAPAEAPAGR